jgi:hypothetical protein
VGASKECALRLADPSRSRAVLVGTAKSGQVDLPDLPAVVHNLAGLAGTLCDRRFSIWHQSGLVVLLNPLRPHATGVAIATAVDEAEDLAFVYLAGHLWLDPPGHPRLALARAEEGTRSPILELHWVINSLEECRALVKVLVLDVHLLGEGAKDPDAAVTLSQLCAADGRIVVWTFATPHPNVYNQPGAAGTTFTGALLDLVQRPHQNYAGLTLADLHTSVTARLCAQGLPAPVLCPDPLDGPPANVVLFHQSSAAPDPSELVALRELIGTARAAERNFREPDIVADRYRSVVIAAQRIVGLDHEISLNARDRLAYWTGQAGDFRSAAYLYQRLWDDRRRLLHPAHPDLPRTETALAYWSQRRR